MAKKHTYILLFLMVFYIAPFLFQFNFGLDVSPLGLLLKLPVFLTLGLITLWFLQKKTELKFLSAVELKDANWLRIIAYSFLLLSILYLLQSLGNISYAKLIASSSNQSESIDSLGYIISKPYLALILVGPFVWLNVLFVEISRAYFHTYLNSISGSKWLGILSVFMVPLVLSSMQIGNSPSQFIGIFITNMTLSLGFILLKDLKPMVIASIIYQSVDLISFWIYS